MYSRFIQGSLHWELGLTQSNYMSFIYHIILLFYCAKFFAMLILIEAYPVYYVFESFLHLLFFIQLIHYFIS